MSIIWKQLDDLLIKYDNEKGWGRVVWQQDDIKNLKQFIEKYKYKADRNQPLTDYEFESLDTIVRYSNTEVGSASDRLFVTLRILTGQHRSTLEENERALKLQQEISRDPIKSILFDAGLSESIPTVKEYYDAHQFEEHRKDIISALTALRDSRLLTKDNLLAFVQHPRNYYTAHGFVEAILLLKNSKHTPLTQKNYNFLCELKNNGRHISSFYSLAKMFEERTNLLTEENLERIAGLFPKIEKFGGRDKDISRFLRHMSQAIKDGLLTQDFFIAIAEVNSPAQLNNDTLEPLSLLKNHHIHIGTETYKRILWHPENINKEILAALLNQNFITNENVDTCLNGGSYLFSIMRVLLNTPLWSKENLERIAAADYLDGTFVMVNLLKKANILTQANFNRSIQSGRRIFYISNGIREQLNRLPDHLVTADFVLRFLQRSEQGDRNINEVSREINEEITRLIEGWMAPLRAGADQARQVRRPVLNDNQSTHTASVHRTVSKSAAKLLEHFGAQLTDKNIQKILGEIHAWADTFGPDVKGSAAKRGVKALTAPAYVHLDERSNVTTLQLIVLIWIGIHTDDYRLGTLDDAKKTLQEGFYEVMRAYNVDAEGKDLGGERDLVACVGGAFNKLMEKMVGVLPDVQIEFITRTTAALKLPQVICEEAISYLRTLPKGEEFNALVAKLKNGAEEGVGPVWDKIKNKVFQRMHDEFQSVFVNDNKGFEEFVAAGEYRNIPIEKLVELEKERATQTVSPEEVGFFALKPTPVVEDPANAAVVAKTDESKEFKP